MVNDKSTMQVDAEHKHANINFSGSKKCVL